MIEPTEINIAVQCNSMSRNPSACLDTYKNSGKSYIHEN